MGHDNCELALSLSSARRVVSGVLCVGVLVVFSLLAPASVFAANASPWWRLASGSRPSVLSSEAGARGEVVITAANLGDGGASGVATPVVIEDKLPAGLKVRSIPEAHAGGFGPEEAGPVVCEKAPLRCTFHGVLPAYDQIEVRIKVETLEGASPGEQNEVSVSGGGVLPASISRPVSLGIGATPFGVEEYELSPEETGGVPATQAGSHPFQLTTAFTLNQDAGKVNEG